MSDTPGRPSEGVIRFHLEHHKGPLPDWADTRAIVDWFGRCRALGGIGRYPPQRFGGAAYGNISQRGETGFLITGSQTGSKVELHPENIAWVREWDLEANRVMSEGPVKPSSESLTHGQLYALRPGTGFVIHVHEPLIWRRAAALSLPVTDPAAEYGTPAMAHEVERLLTLPETLCDGVIVMGGHEDGVLVFGDHPEQAGLRLLRLYRRACRHGNEDFDGRG